MRRALAITTSERYFGLIANFATLAVVSRVLSPAEIGVAVLGMAIAGLGLALREFATPNYIIPKKDLKTEDVRASFTVSLLLTSTISVLLWVSALPLSEFYGDRDLVPFLHVVGLCLLLNVVYDPVAALLRRKMDFQKLAGLNVTAAAVNSAVTIVLALLGFSYMSFAWGLLASLTSIAILSVLVCDDHSIFRPSLKGWQSVIAFGGYHGVNFLLHRLYDSLPYLVLGRTLSLHSVALYNRGLSICQIPDKIVLGGISTVLLSSYSAEVRNGGNLRASYLRGIETITALQWPGLILVAILAHPIVILVLGEQWVASVPLVQIMALASLFTFATPINYPILVSFGAMRDALIRSVIVWPLSALIIAGASVFGLKAAAMAWLVTTPMQAYVSLYFVRKHVPITWRQVGGSLWRSAVLALMAGAGPIAVLLYMGGRFDLPLPAVAVSLLLAGLGWSVGLLLTAHPLIDEIKRAIAFARNIMQGMKSALPRRAATKGLIWKAPG